MSFLTNGQQCSEFRDLLRTREWTCLGCLKMTAGVSYVKVCTCSDRPMINSNCRTLRTSLLTYFMAQSPSRAADWFATSQEFPRISRNPKVHYRTHKRTPPVSILGQPNPVHIPTSNLLEIHPNIIHPSTPRSPQWSLYLRFPHQDPIHSPGGGMWACGLDWAGLG